MEDRTEKILDFLKEISKFKEIKREVFYSDGRAETDAEHAWHLAMFLILFEKEFPEDLDLKKTLKIALIHDLPEIYAGDTFAFDKEGRETKKDREDKAANDLFSQLPEDLEEEFRNLFAEYETQSTKEAKIVKSFDKLQPILQNLVGKGESWEKHKISLNEIDEYKRPHMKHNDLINEIYEKLLEEIRSRGLTRD